MIYIISFFIFVIMIVIDLFEISEDQKELHIVAHTDAGQILDNMYIWSHKNYKEEVTIDFGNLKFLQNDNHEDIIITAEEYGVTHFSGNYYIEITDTAGSEEQTSKIGIASNLIKYYECVWDKVLKYKVDGCKIIIPECQNCCYENINYLYIILKTVEIAIQEEKIIEANRVLNLLDEYCDTCTNCPDYSSLKLFEGMGFITENDIVIPIKKNIISSTE